MNFPESKIIVFAKAPVAGKAKTRLIPVLGETGASDLHKQMLAHTLEKVCPQNIAPVELHCAPDTSHVVFQIMASHFNLPLIQQQGNNLGERMSSALDNALRDCRHAILIGSDCPALDAAYIQRALEILASGTDIVIGPADDGGYVLIGMTASQPEVFIGIDWGSDQVLQQTRNRIHALNLSHKELHSLRDIDTPEDMEYFKNNRQFAHLRPTWM